MHVLNAEYKCQMFPYCVETHSLAALVRLLERSPSRPRYFSSNYFLVPVMLKASHVTPCWWGQTLAGHHTQLILLLSAEVIHDIQSWDPAQLAWSRE